MTPIVVSDSSSWARRSGSATCEKDPAGFQVQCIIAGIQGPVSYLVQVASGDVWCRHVDHIRDGRLRPTSASDCAEENHVPDLDDSLALPGDLSSPSSVSSNQDSTPAQQLDSPPRWYPLRVRQPPIRYGQ